MTNALLWSASRACRVVLCGWLGLAAVTGQVKMDGAESAGGSPQPGDLAALQSSAPRNELHCTALPVRPVLGFDLKFQARYQVEAPLALLSQSAGVTVVFRVASEKDREHAAYFTRHYNLPAIDRESRGNAHIEGRIELGAGAYHMDWLLRDGHGRACRVSWDFNASLPGRDQDLPLNLPSGAVEAFEEDPFRPAASSDAAADEAAKSSPPSSDAAPDPRPVSVKFFVNLEPEDERFVTPEAEELAGIASALSTLGRDRRFGKLSIVVYGWTRQQVLYRREGSPIDFAGLSNITRSPHLGTVAFRNLEAKSDSAGFLEHLLNDELSFGERPDVVVFIGPRGRSAQNVSLHKAALAGHEIRFFDVAFVPSVADNPWRDSIGKLVKTHNGREYLIAQPLDLAMACQDILGQVAKSRPAAAGRRSR